MVAQILAALNIAAEKGLRLPLVYNTSGYDSLEALALLDGIVDIYMSDMKYGDDNLARKYLHVRDYMGRCYEHSFVAARGALDRISLSAT